MTDTLGLDAPARARRVRKPKPLPLPAEPTFTPGKRNQRRSTFTPVETDLWTKYAHITPRWKRAAAFIEGECRVPSGRHVGEYYTLHPYQLMDLAIMLDEETIVCVVSAPRGFTKSGLLAALYVWALYDREGAQVIAFSTGMRTARISYDRAVRIIDMNPRLSEQALVLANSNDPKVELPGRGAVLFPLPAEEKMVIGGAPSFCGVDEIGYVDEATYGTMQSALGKQDGCVLIAFGTPGLGIADRVGQPNFMYHLRTLAQGEDPPPNLVYIEHAADRQADPSLPATWREANPAIAAGLIGEREVALDYRTLSPSRFGQMRLGWWTQHESAWMQESVWGALDVEDGDIPAGAAIGLGFDGSTSGDATAIVGIDVATHRVCVLGLWERPAKAPRSWQVPVQEVMDRIHDIFATYRVVKMLADPWHWRKEVQSLVDKYGESRVEAFNTAAAVRMGPATDAFLSATMQGDLKWDGRPELQRHMLAAIAKQTQHGDVLVKDARKPQKIDLAIAAILAHEVILTVTPRKERKMW